MRSFLAWVSFFGRVGKLGLYDEKSKIVGIAFSLSFIFVLELVNSAFKSLS